MRQDRELQRLSILIAGHRPDRLGGVSMQPIEAALAGALEAINRATPPDIEPWVLTGAAEGVDTLVSDIVAQRELPLELLISGCPQALAPAQQRAVNTVWLGAPNPLAEGEEAIAVRDEIALGFADILVVVWDGEAPQGLNGGTVRLAFQAALAMTPTVWIDTNGAVRLLDRQRLTAPLLRRLRTPHPDVVWLRQAFGDPLSAEALDTAVAAELDAYLGPENHLANGEDTRRRLTYYQHPPDQAGVKTRADALHKFMVALLNGELQRVRKRAISHYWGAAAGDHEIVAPRAYLDAQFEAADMNATLAAGRHRDSTWQIYAAAAMAVFAAVAGAIHLWPGAQGVFWAVVELAVIVFVIVKFTVARRQRWHERWIGNRFIAEQLRYARVCLPALAIPSLYYAPAWQAGPDGVRLRSPEIWWIQRTLRRQGLPRASAGGDFLAADPKHSVEFKAYFRAVVDEQRSYHDVIAQRFHKAHHRLHGLSIGLFGLTVAAVCAHFIIHAQWLLIFTAFFPALAAAIHGLSTKLEIGRLSAQHAITAEQLEDIVSTLDQLDVTAQPGWLTWLRLREIARAAAGVMSEENDRWRELIDHQETELPA